MLHCCEHVRLCYFKPSVHFKTYKPSLIKSRRRLIDACRLLLYLPTNAKQRRLTYAYANANANPYMQSYYRKTFCFSFHSCVNIFCQISIHFCCCSVRAFPGVLNDLFMISRSLVRRVLMASMVFQSETANRALLPSSMKTPAYIYSFSSVLQILGDGEWDTHIATNIST